MRRWPGRPLLGTAQERRWSWALLAGCVLVVVALGVAFAHQATADGFDRAVDNLVIRSLGRHYTLVHWMSWPGTQVPAVGASLVMAAACLQQRRLNGALLALAADFAATRLDDGLLKYLFHRTYLGALTYPSGHTTSIVSLAAVYVVLFTLPRPGAGRVQLPGPGVLAGLVVLLALALGTMLGVIGLRWHYFTDTIGGAAVAVGTVCALSLLLDWLWRRLQLG
jgi:membrane-associated phospholipid phosphatase